MKKDFTELKETIRDEVLWYLVKQDIELSNHAEVENALDDFCSDAIVNYMDEHKLELGWSFKVTEDNNISIDVWEW